MKLEKNNYRLASNGQAIQVLFVDDEEQVLRYVKKNLCSMGYDVLTTTDWDGARGLLKDPDIQPELIFIEPFLGAGQDMPLW